MASAKEIYFGGAYFLYKDVFDRTPVLEEIYSLLRDLDSVETVATLCRINTELRLAKRERTAIGKLQQTLGGAFLDEETVARFKGRFGINELESMVESAEGGSF